MLVCIQAGVIAIPKAPSRLVALLDVAQQVLLVLLEQSLLPGIYLRGTENGPIVVIGILVVLPSFCMNLYSLLLLLHLEEILGEYAGQSGTRSKSCFRNGCLKTSF